MGYAENSYPGTSHTRPIRSVDDATNARGSWDVSTTIGQNQLQKREKDSSVMAPESLGAVCPRLAKNQNSRLLGKLGKMSK